MAAYTPTIYPQTGAATDITAVKLNKGEAGIQTAQADADTANAALAAKAPLASPALTGTPTAPTAALATNTTQLATTAFVLANAGTANASTTVKGIAKLATAPVLATNPIAVGDNDPRLALGDPNTQTAATYTFVLGDGTKVVEGNSASAQTFTIPTNATVAFAVGTEIVVRQYGAGQITIAPGTTTLRSRGAAYKLAGQFAEATLTKRAADEWILSGDTAV